MMPEFPAIHAPVCHTATGTPYLRAPGVTMLAMPTMNIEQMRPFLEGFSPSLEFPQYLDDVPLPPAEYLIKTASQLCYMSFGPKGRTKNADAGKYLDHILSSGHGSVLEHANFSFLFYGISRSVTHELVRHRAGFAYSQVSQRYVSGKVLRFVERPEYVNDPPLHAAFEARIDRAAAEYASLAERLLTLQKEGKELLHGESRTDLRKKVQQCARSLLPNETEAPIVTTANVRAWRHFIEMRGAEGAETEIRALALRVFSCLREVAPLLFADYHVAPLPDGTSAVGTRYRKV